MKNREGYYEDGTKVLIFKTKGEDAPLRDEDGDFIVGTIIGRTESDDLAYHGSAWYEYIYTVADENGKLKAFVSCNDRPRFWINEEEDLMKF